MARTRPDAGNANDRLLGFGVHGTCSALTAKAATCSAGSSTGPDCRCSPDSFRSRSRAHWQPAGARGRVGQPSDSHRDHAHAGRVLRLPRVLLAIAIAAAIGSGISNAIIALTVILIPPVARVAETETARLRSADFLEAARASGARFHSIAARQVVPNVAPAIVVYCTTLIGLSIVYAAGLSFLGLGVAPSTAEWAS